MSSPVQISIWPRTVCDVSTGEIMADTSCPQDTESRKPKHRYRNFFLLYDIPKRFIVEKTMDKLRVYRTNFTAPVHHSVACERRVAIESYSPRKEKGFEVPHKNLPGSVPTIQKNAFLVQQRSSCINTKVISINVFQMQLLNPYYYSGRRNMLLVN